MKVNEHIVTQFYLILDFMVTVVHYVFPYWNVHKCSLPRMWICARYVMQCYAVPFFSANGLVFPLNVCLSPWSRSFRNLEHCRLVQDAKMLGTDQASRRSASSYVKCQLLQVKWTSSISGIRFIALILERGYTACQTTGQVTFVSSSTLTFGSVLRCYGNNHKGAFCHHLFLLCE